MLLFGVLLTLAGTLVPMALVPSASIAPSVEMGSLAGPLGNTFHPGVILSGGSNGTASFLGGIGVYDKPTDFSLPVLAGLSIGPTGPRVQNWTPAIASEFAQGGVYGIGWNGSTWLFGGQRFAGGSNMGALATLRDGTTTNWSEGVAGFFGGGGIFSIGWNGTAWLIGGNSTQGPVLLSWEGGVFRDLSGRLVGHEPRGWVQLLEWNGAEWLVGGGGIFGLLRGAEYSDLIPRSPIVGNGVFSGAWTGTSWIVGGFGGRLGIVEGPSSAVVPLPIPAEYSQMVTLVVIDADGSLLVGGRGVGPTGGDTPVLLQSSGMGAGVLWTDLSGRIPVDFAGGEIQGAVPAPFLGTDAYWIVGEGNYNLTTGHGVGALGLLTWGPGP